MPSNTITISSTGGSKSLTNSKKYTADNIQSYEFTVADGLTDTLVEMAFAKDPQLKAIYIVSDQTVTVEFNSTVGAGGTINLVAGVPYVWDTDLGTYYTNKITANVTASYWTNASGALATVNIELVVDPTA